MLPKPVVDGKMSGLVRRIDGSIYVEGVDVVGDKLSEAARLPAGDLFDIVCGVGVCAIADFLLKSDE